MGCSNSKTSPEEDSGMQDIETTRGCTDIIWIPIFAVFWIGMVAIAIIGFNMGKPNKLIYATDYDGEICGEAANAGKIRAVYPRLTEDIFAMAQQASEEGTDVDPTTINFYAVCVDKCPVTNEWICDRTGEAKLVELKAEQKADQDVKLQACADKTFAKGGAFLGKDPGLTGDETCQNLLEHCWKIDSDTRSIFYRCMPLHNITKGQTSECIYPDSSIAIDDDRCSKMRVTETTIAEQPAKKNYLYDQMNSVFATVMRYFGDIQKSMHVILLSGGVGALVVGLFWLIALRYFAGCMVWSSLAMVICLAITFTCFCFSKAGLISGERSAMMSSRMGDSGASYLKADEENKQAWTYVSYGCALLTILMLVVIAAMKSKIHIAVGIVKETSKAVHDMKMLMLYPLITTSLLIVLMVWWLIVAAYIISADGLTLNNIKSSGALNYKSPFGSKSAVYINGTEQCQSDSVGYDATFNNCLYDVRDATTDVRNVTVGQNLYGYGDYETTGTADYNKTALIPSVNSSNTNSTGFGGIDGNQNAMRYIMMYHFFGLLWTNQLIQGVAIMVISGAFSKWYFAGPHDAEDDDRPEDYSERMSTPVLKSCCRTVRYHLGTVMFGGFIIAVVQFVRAALAYVEENTKTWQEKNKLLKCAFKLIGCILYCFEKCVKYVSKMAYITTAISGTSFCVSAYRSIQLFQRESSLISIVYMISQFILTLSKVLISLTSGCLAYLWLTYGFPEGEGVSNAAFPLLLSMIFGYFVAEAVLDVYTTGIDTILLCYSLDKENNAENGNLKAGSSLRKFIAHNKTKKKTASGEEEEDDEDDMSDAKFAAVAPEASGNGGGAIVSI